MTNRAVKSEFDMDSFFDFNQSTTQPSPMTATSSMNDSLSPFGESKTQYNGPSHDYNQHKQQVGLPVGSMANLPPQSFDGYNSGIGDMGFDGGFGGWSSGIDIDSDMGMDFNNPSSAMPAMFFPAPNDNTATSSFVDPTSIQEETASTVRLWPGMHSQRAQQVAMQKAQQVQGMQQRQMKLQAQQAQYHRHASSASQTQVPQLQAPQPQTQVQPQQQPVANGKRASHAADPHVEESISRLLNKMREQSNADADGDDDLLPHIARMKRDEDDMDEDERLLNSEEGKKLSSKERRQLRNKVSARAFRSRRKEYISQLEGEVALKAQESNQLRQENQQLLQENDRYRGLIETLLRHPAFTPFIQDISKDPAILGMPQHQTQHVQASQQQAQQLPAPTPAQQPAQPAHQQQQQDVKPDFMNFDASQLEIPESQQQVSLAMIPEENFSKLNLGMQNNMANFSNYSVNAYAMSIPPGPDPQDLLFAPTPARLPTDHSVALPNYNNTNTNMESLLARLDGAARRMAPA